MKKVQKFKFKIGKLVGQETKSIIYIDRFKLFSPHKYNWFQKIIARAVLGWKIYDYGRYDYVQPKDFQRFAP
jgi:hypothetical protein